MWARRHSSTSSRPRSVSTPTTATRVSIPYDDEGVSNVSDWLRWELWGGDGGSGGEGGGEDRIRIGGGGGDIAWGRIEGEK